MGFYYNKLMAMQEETSVEKAVEDGIQTPNDVGVDLNHVEDVISGDEGIEAHKEEIEDDMEGIVGDPLDECTIIMYESEYNFNQLMKCIGIEELNEFAQGKDFILEGGNLKAFIENAKKILKGMWEKAKAIFNAAIDKIEQIVNVNKALVKAKEAKIKEGFEKGNWKFTGVYNFTDMDIKYNPKPIVLVDMLNNTGELPDITSLPSYVFGAKYLGIKDYNGVVTAFKADHLQLKDYSPENSSSLLNTVLNILKEDKTTIELRKIYREIDDEYRTLLNDIDRLESEINDDKKQHIPELVKLAQHEKYLQHMYFTTCYDIHKKRASQARKFAIVWLKNAGEHMSASDKAAESVKKAEEYMNKYEEAKNKELDERHKNNEKFYKDINDKHDKFMKDMEHLI